MIFLIPLMLLMRVQLIRSRPRIILDTDMSTDCDDVGALCILNALADNGEADILAVMHNTGLNTGIGAVSVINTYYDREVPLGAYKGDYAKDERGKYVDDLVAKFPSPIKNYSQVPDAVEVYRKVLSEQVDNSVTIVSIGFTTNLEPLLRSRPDAYSPLNGSALIAAKVVQLAWMGGRYPSGSSYNFGHDGVGKSTQSTQELWPRNVPRLYTGWEIGSAINSGGAMTSGTPESNPCRQAYIDRQGPGNDRMSWDLTAVLMAIRGRKDYWDAFLTGYNNISNNGSNNWVTEGKFNYLQAYLLKKMNPNDIGKILDSLLIQPPHKSSSN